MPTTHSILRGAPQLDAEQVIGPMTEQEFVDWCTADTWAEWVDGEVVVMSPVSTSHGRIKEFLARLIGTFVEEFELGEIFTEPVQTRFARLKRRRSPDILYVSAERAARVKPHHIEGAPDLVVEVISRESISRDRREKFAEYESAGVREYWIVDPLYESVEAYSLEKRKFISIEEIQGAIRSTVLPRFYIKPAWLWRVKLPKVSEVLREMSAKR
jgi:Uma2 family endonuclease